MLRKGAVFELHRSRHAFVALLASAFAANATALADPVVAGSPSPIAASPSPEPADSLPPDVAQLTAKIKAAEGKRPENERTVTTVVENGRTKTLTTVRIGDNVRVTLQDGPFLTARGVDDGQHWHQNANGLSILDQPRRGHEASEVETVTLRHVTTPFVADVIARLNAKGDGTKKYVDPATSRIVRLDEIRPTETSVTTYDDFRTTAGHVRPWHERTTDGHAANDSDEHIASIVTTGLTAADAAVPAPRRALVAFPAGVTSIDLPAHLDENQQFIVRVAIGGRGLDFIVDTGAADIVLDRDVALSLGLKLYDEGSNASNAGRYAESSAIVSEMNVGSLSMKDVVVDVIPNLSFASPSVPVKVVGLLGFDFIASLALSLDYEAAKVTAVDYDAFKAPADPHTIALPIRVGEQGPETDVTINDRLGERFEIDTGGIGGVMITDVFTRRYPGVTRSLRDLGHQVELGGVGGTFMTKLYAVPRLRLGTTTFRDFTALVINSDRMYASDGADGVIGPELLQYFTLTTDYADSTIYLTPNKLGKESMKSGT